ncbi:MAG: hypothetical protein EOP05_09625 [Proteobacteria bacterium]|nr:MAG: hypothetical protein EOP05_09625 [Pseudomonadota bacterium]
MIGAPLFSYLIGLLILPWGLIAALLAGGAFIGTWALCQLALLSAVLVCNSLGLLISSNPTLKSGRANLAAGSIVGVILVSLLTAMINVRVEEVKLVTFYTLDLNPGWFLTLTAFAFGIWIFLGAKWQIGRDYLEQRKAWRLPAFLLFTGFYFNGFIGAENFARIVMSGLAVFIFGAAMSQLSGETFSLKAWYERVRNKLPNAVQAIPIWLSGWMSLVTITIAYSVYHRNLILFPLVFFSLRDLVLLEASRYFGFKQSRNFALALVLCLYVVPLFFVPFYAPMLAIAAPISLVVPDLFSSTFSYPVLKAFSPTLLYSLSLGSGVLQAVIAAGLLAIVSRKSNVELRQSL